MAATGSITFSRTKQEGRKSTILVTAKVTTDSYSSCGESGDGTLTIKQGSTTLKTVTIADKAVASSSSVEVASASVEVTHGGNGKASAITATLVFAKSLFGIDTSKSYTPTDITQTELTVNYYSNYADYGTHQGVGLNVSSDKNIKVFSNSFAYSTAYANGLANIQNASYLYLTRTGYSSTGKWGTSASGGTLVDQNTEFDTGQALAQALGKDISSGNASVNVYAQWVANTYTITYNANGGEHAPVSLNYEYSPNGLDVVAFPSDYPVKHGYECIGWSTDKNSTVAEYLAGSAYPRSIAEDRTYYAIWKKKTNCFVKRNDEYKMGMMYVKEHGTYKTGEITVNQRKVE